MTNLPASSQTIKIIHFPLELQIENKVDLILKSNKIAILVINSDIRKKI
jgi:hypothetical protein